MTLHYFLMYLQYCSLSPLKYIPIVLTLVTNEGGNDRLLKKVAQELQNIENQLIVDITLQNVDRFGEYEVVYDV